MLVPAVDADGNELGGVPTVLRDAPLGTYLGWNITADSTSRLSTTAGHSMPDRSATTSAAWCRSPCTQADSCREIHGRRWKSDTGHTTAM